ncbi:hypothetical protein M601_013985 [Cellulophaga baltica 4]|nr:hypothetical protein M601_013985 [Cellulophaga baltica 4]
MIISKTFSLFNGTSKMLALAGAEGAFSVKTKLSDYEWKVNPLRKNANKII